MKKMIKLALATTAALALQNVYAAKPTFCVFDLVGTQGDVYAMMKDYQLAAKSWGSEINLKAYTDERVLTEDFKAGKCDGASITGIRGRQFNSFVGSIDAIGGLPNLNLTVKFMQTLADPRFAADMKKGKYEVVGIVPVGDAFLMVNDRSINTVAKAAGKKIAILDYDNAQKKMVQQIGAQAVSADVTNFGSKFNNGEVDIIGAPAAVFRPLELHKGLGSKGAIVNYPILQVSGNLIIHADKFPAGFGQKSRTWIKGQLPRAFQILGKMKSDIPAKYWMEVPEGDKLGYQKMMRESRIQLTKEGIYDKKMMELLWRARCAENRQSFECSLPEEQYSKK